MLRRADFDALVGVGLLMVLAPRDWAVVVCGLLWLVRAERRAEGSLTLESAARAAMLGGFAGRMALIVVPVALTFLVTGWPVTPPPTLLLGELPHGGDLQELSLNVFGRGLLILARSFLLGFSVRCVLPRLAL